jgi:conjugal transfer pilus assembly protein TrbC
VLVFKLKYIITVLLSLSAALWCLECATATDVNDMQGVVNKVNLNLKQSGNNEEEEVQKIMDYSDKLTSEENAQEKYYVEARKVSEVASKTHEKNEFRKTADWVRKNQKTFADKPVGRLVASSTEKDAISTILKNYSAKAENFREQRVSYYPVMIFVSSSLPHESLKGLMQQAKGVGAILVFRGMIGNGIKDTAEFLATINRENVSAIIDPRLFEIFDVKEAPTFVVLAQNSQDCVDGNCMITPKHDRMVGNVTLDYVLETMALGKGDAQHTARSFVKRVDSKDGERS